ncbi:MAG: tetratricopeptide repeat protein [Dongiaceae bacterium]
MSLKDQRGTPVSTSNRRALDGLEAAHALYQGYFNDPVAAIDAALANDPDFMMGHAFRGGLFALSSEKGALPEVAKSVAAMARNETRANDRERGHLAALNAWLEGDFHGACQRYGDVVADYPRDMIALQFAHQTDFLLGQSRMLRDRIAGILPNWSENDAGYGYLLGMYCFGLEEMGHYAEAEDVGRKAVALNPRDTWAIHGVAHVLEMQGRLDAGIDWLATRSEDWSQNNGFAFHNWWHLALHHLERGEYDRALEIYDASIHPAPTGIAMELLDAAALLWRLHLRGVETGRRWVDVADSYEPMAEDGFYPFNDMHAVMAFVATGRWDAVQRVLKTLAARAGDTDSGAQLIREVGLPVARAIEAFGRGDYTMAVDLLRPVRLVAHRFGGSHAQRDVLDLTMIEAALRDGQYGLAEMFANERLARKPDSPLAGWFRQRARDGRASKAVHAA